MSGLVFDPDNPPSIRAIQEEACDYNIRDLYYSRFPRHAGQIFSRNLCQEVVLTDPMTSIVSPATTTAVRPEVGEVSLGSNPQIDLSSFIRPPEPIGPEAYRRFNEQVNRSSRRYDFVPYQGPSTEAFTQSTNRGSASVTQTSDSKVMLLAALLSAEQARCQAKEDLEERDNSLGNLVEATPEVKDRIAQGLSEYLSLVSEPAQAASRGDSGINLTPAERDLIRLIRSHVHDYSEVRYIRVVNAEQRHRGECTLTVRIIS